MEPVTMLGTTIGLIFLGYFLFETETPHTSTQIYRLRASAWD